MSFLDGIMVLIIICSMMFSRPLKEKAGFDRDTTATSRGLAMIGIMLHHIHNELGYSSFMLVRVGYLATGLFFFISGYGNTLSICKYNKLKIEWLLKKLIKLYLPFFAAYWIYYICLISFYPNLCPSGKECLGDLFTLSLPNQVSWFPKIILLCFIFHWSSKNIFRNIRVQNTVIALAIMIYMVVMWKMGWPSYWYDSIACYAAGCIVAKPIAFATCFNILKKKKLVSFVGISALFIGSILLSPKSFVISLLCPILISLALYYFSFAFTIKIPIMEWIGNNSFEFYVFHVVCLQAFACLEETNKYHYAIAVFLGSFLIVYVYLLVKSMLAKLRMKMICK